MAHLYYGEPGRLINIHRLRELARFEVTNSKLIRLAATGDHKAAFALLSGFWPFVWAFEKVIDRRRLPMAPLEAKFGKTTVRRTFLETARHVKRMAQEEGEHSGHWRCGALDLGLVLPVHRNDEYASFVATAIGRVRGLIESASSGNLTQFFGCLAGTEFIAEELSLYLSRHSPDFVSLFANNRWEWGEVHVATHSGPSHLDIDLDLARAYCESGDQIIAKEQIESAVSETIHLFGEAAEDVYAHEFRDELVAAQ